MVWVDEWRGYTYVRQFKAEQRRGDTFSVILATLFMRYIVSRAAW